MAENETETDDWPSEEQRSEWWRTEAIRQAVPDQLLSVFVNIANKEGTSVGVTLWVGGSVISGMLASPETYIDRVASEVEEGGSDGLASLGSALRQLMLDGSPDTDDDPLAPGPTAIHLIDATVLDSNNWNTLSAWRGRLTAVDAWTFGIAKRT